MMMSAFGFKTFKNRDCSNTMRCVLVVLLLACVAMKSEALFKGVVKKIGIVKGFYLPAGKDRTVAIKAEGMESLDVGDSIACSGASLTVMNITGDIFKVQMSFETTQRSTLGNWTLNRKVNLEQGMRFTDKIDGNLMTGHVDDIVRIKSIQFVVGSYLMRISCEPQFMPLIVKKGSVALDGVCLTVSEVEEDGFSVNINAYTWKATTFQYNRIGDYLNLEGDIITRYMNRIKEHREKKAKS